MDPLRCSSRVLKLTQDIHDDPGTNPVTSTATPFNKFNATPAPIARPPSSCGNRLINTKIEKIEPNHTRKRQKWNDRFHLQTNEEPQAPVTSVPPAASLHFNQRSNAALSGRRKPTLPSSSEKRKTKSSVIPPIDIITGRREWGKRPRKKRAKWSHLKQKDSDNNHHRHHLPAHPARTRATHRVKWKKPQQSVSSYHAQYLSSPQAPTMEMEPNPLVNCIDHLFVFLKAEKHLFFVGGENAEMWTE